MKPIHERRNPLPESSPSIQGRHIRIGGSVLGPRAHICAFFNGPDDEYRVLLPFIKDGLDAGEKAVHTVDPDRREEHFRQLESAGLDLTALRTSGQIEVRTWIDTHLRDGKFDPDATLELFGRITTAARQQGYPLIRFVTHMEWALANIPDLNDLLEYEAKANEAWLRREQPVHPVVCTYDLTKFRGDIVVDVMRTHPMIIVGGVLQENPFFVPPAEFLAELRARRVIPIR